MNTSEQYHQPVLEALCAFVRDGTKTKIDDNVRNKSDRAERILTTDIQAALTVIGRRAAGLGFVDCLFFGFQTFVFRRREA